MPKVDVESYDDYICDGCPMFEIEVKELFVHGVVLERVCQCKHFHVCQLVIPRVRALDRDLQARMEGGGADG